MYNLKCASFFFFFFVKGPNPTCEVFLWSSQQTFQPAQSIPFPGLSSVHAFTPPSGIRMLIYFITFALHVVIWHTGLVEMSSLKKLYSILTAYLFLSASLAGWSKRLSTVHVET